MSQNLEWFENAIKLESIFMPSARRRRDNLYNGNAFAKFVHYTTAEAALGIIRSKSLWMRNTKCMSDFREITHGREMLKKHFSETNAINNFRELMNKCLPGSADKMVKLFDQWMIDTEFNTYISSISEHDPTEDQHGRLSMWRAFGGNSARVAIVLNVPWIPKRSLELAIGFAPVLYHNEKLICNEFNEILQNISQNIDFIKSANQDEVEGTIYNMLLSFVVSTKHDGFAEEREWRAIYRPQQNPSHHMNYEVEVINGIPQMVYKLPLDKDDLDFVNLFDRLIIGPTQYPSALGDAFNSELQKIGVADSEKRINISGIPIRT